MQCIADGDCHRRSAHRGSKSTDSVWDIIDRRNRHGQHTDVKLCSQRIDDRTDQ